jgi:hypothetical protein
LIATNDSWRVRGRSSHPIFAAACSCAYSPLTWYAASGSESQTKKYINVASGDSTDASLDEVVARLCALGYTAQKLPGPLLLATTGGNRQVPKLLVRGEMF